MVFNFCFGPLGLQLINLHNFFFLTKKKQQPNAYNRVLHKYKSQRDSQVQIIRIWFLSDIQIQLIKHDCSTKVDKWMQLYITSQYNVEGFLCIING